MYTKLHGVIAENSGFQIGQFFTAGFIKEWAGMLGFLTFCCGTGKLGIRMIKSRRMRWAGHVVRMGETRNAYRILVGKPEGKRPPSIPGRNFV
jgi:hypothetical protein